MKPLNECWQPTTQDSEMLTCCLPRLPGLALKPCGLLVRSGCQGARGRPVGSDSPSHAYALLCRVTGHLSLCCLFRHYSHCDPRPQASWGERYGFFPLLHGFCIHSSILCLGSA